MGYAKTRRYSVLKITAPPDDWAAHFYLEGKGMKKADIQWHEVMSSPGIKASAYGPFLRLTMHSNGQNHSVFFMPDGQKFTTEAAFVRHVNRIAK